MGITTRRAFSGGMFAAACFSAIPMCTSTVQVATDYRKSVLSFSQLMGRMEWLNPPASAKVDGERLLVRASPRTDFWRKTRYDYTKDNGHFFHASLNGDFDLKVRVTGHYGVQYDQAGLMVRVDSANWMRCGVVLSEGVGHGTVVVTREFSDWSTVPGVTVVAPVSWKVERRGNSLQVLYSLNDQDYIPVRLGYLALPAVVDAGIMCASPEGPGFDCVFDMIQLQQQG